MTDDTLRPYTLAAIGHAATLNAKLVAVADPQARAALTRHYLDTLEEHLRAGEATHDIATAYLLSLRLRDDVHALQDSQ